jgi:heat shock protein HtpX
MYNAIASNRRKTVLLMTLVAALFMVVGWAFGLYNGDPYGGIIVAGIVSLGLNVGSYFWSDRIALASTGATIIEAHDAPQLWRTVENLSIAAGMPMPRVGLLHDASPNAFATGRNAEHATIVVSTGLLDLLSQTELEGVIAHELSHIKNNDILLMTVAVVLIGSLALLARSRWYSSDHDRRQGPLAILAVALIILAPIIGELMKLAISRQREYLADASGALLTRYPEGLASALEKISQSSVPLARASHATAHLFIANPFGFTRLSSWLSTHPPTDQRVARLRSMI